MKKSRSLFPTVIATALLTLMLGACGGDSPESLILSSKDYLAKNDAKAAVIQLKNALQKNPNLAEARFLLGSALLESGDVAGAEVELRKALELKHSPDATVPLLARAILATGKAQKLVDEFGKTKLTNGQSLASLNTTLSAAYASLGKREVARDLLAEALAASPDYAPARLADIRETVANKDIAGARSKLDSLLIKDPNNPEALLIKGNLLDFDGDAAGALAQYQRAISAKPSFLNAHSAAVGSLLKAGKIDEAAKQLDSLKKISQKHPQVYLLDAQINYQRKDYKAARESAQQLLRISPNNPISLQMAGAIEYQLRSYLQAETYLAKALQSAPGLPLARRLLVASHLRTGHSGKALETLQPVLGRIDQDSALLALAGEAYLQQGEPNKAAEYFAKASKLEPENAAKKTSLALAHLAQGNSESAYLELEQISVVDKGITADLALIAAHLRNNQLDKALKAIDRLEKKQPNNPATHNLKARALLARKDITGARQSFEKAVSINPTFFPAVASLATLDLLDKKPNDARKRFEAMISADPKNMQALLALAELKAANGGTPDEVSSLIGKAISAAPSEPTPRLALIQYYLKLKENKKALTAANEAASAIQDKPEILDALGRTQQLAGDLNQAQTTYGKLASLQPASPSPLLRLAEIQFANKNKEDGIKNLKKALQIKPDIVDAQRALLLIAMEGKNTKNALEIARTVQKQRPKEAVGYVLEGDIHAFGKVWPEAIKIFRSGLKQVAAPELAIKLHESLIASENSAEADKTAGAWLKDHPKDIAFRVYLGDRASGQRNFAQAVNHYQAALELQPNNALILNNLAWASGQLKSPKALEYAEKANQLAPNQPAFMDTLAMLLADKGEPAKAVELLRKALTAAPQASAIQLNLAKVLIASGKKDEARKELEALSKLGDKYSGQGEVSLLLKSL
ncbi:XrtA/PEP-CTERM system TPR-repeat protein PrsT [Ferribacterium limneticum]|uniref:XrtA/PEP-CTERM system TPR-repeat protein PrsT n=1 Tax=Ferribacterium limneticum TaxID=76259 RepID=UPI001CF9E9AA|nr:XrtA/PEP-CTERM system TPR-repeat protein PrsT [Ferribacterium limneticum]UCV17298.1 PEP-CTERM system TPR-repeat protein PrsT [Ferribacterium limneticum]